MNYLNIKVIAQNETTKLYQFQIRVIPSPPSLLYASYDSTSTSITLKNISPNRLIYRSTSLNGNYEYVGTSAGDSLTDTGLSPNTTYYYKSSWIDNGVESLLSDSYFAKTKSSALPPQGLSVSGNFLHSIRLTWTPESNAVYNIYRSGSSNGTYTKISSSFSTNIFTDSSLSKGITNYYRISSIIGGYESDQSDPVAGSTIPSPALNSPSNFNISAFQLFSVSPLATRH